jgi:hypothetical protein
MDQKMALSTQKLDFEREIAEITKKFTSIIRENENRNFIQQQDLKIENSNLVKSDIENNKNIELLKNELDLNNNELNLYKYNFNELKN